MKHLIFLLWKIQCHLDGNKKGWGDGGVMKLLAQYVALFVTQKRLIVLLCLLHPATCCSTSLNFSNEVQFGLAVFNYELILQVLDLFQVPQCAVSPHSVLSLVLCLLQTISHISSAQTSPFTPHQFL